MKHILIIDDDVRICTLLMRLLRRHHYEISIVYSSMDALKVARFFHYDALITDVMMPEISGHELVTKIRLGESYFHKNIPILMISALWEKNNRIEGIAGGADDYLVKPFEPDELVVRLAALLRRSEMSLEKNPVQSLTENSLMQDGFILDRGKLCLIYEGNNIELSFNEMECIAYLMAHTGVVHSRYDLMLKFFPDLADNPTSRALDVMMARIRRKIDTISDKNPIMTRRGEGYVWQK